MNLLPEKLLKLRKHYKFSQEYLSQVLEVKIEDYMAIENGRVLPSYNELLQLCDLYKINLSELFVNEKEVTLYEVDDTTTDQINIDYFMKQYRWYNRLFNYIKMNRTLQYFLVVILLGMLIVLGIVIRTLNKPLEFDVSEYEKLSVSDNSVAYVLGDGTLKVTGLYEDVSDSEVVKAVTGTNFIAVLKEDGTVNLYGSTSEMKKQVVELKNIEDILASDDHIIAIDKFSKIYCLGGNAQSEISLENMKNTTNLKTFENCSIGVGEDGYLIYAGEVVGRSQFKRYRYPLDYDANDSITVVLKSDGTADYSAYEDHYSAVLGWTDLVQIACGDSFIAGLKKDGTVVLAGNDEEMIKEVTSWKNITSIDAGSDYLIGFDGKQIVGTGENAYQQFVKEEKEIKRADAIDPSTLIVTFASDTITVEFDGVENAYAYEVSLIAGTTTAYEIKANEKAVFSSSNLSEGMYYTISIVSLGNKDYEDSIPFDYSFEYLKPEEKKEETTEKKEDLFELEQPVGKTRKELEDYLKEHNVPSSQIEAIEDEEECNGDEEIILSLTGYEEKEMISESELAKRSITYHYCRLKKNEE